MTRHLEVSVYDAIQRVVQGTFAAATTSWGMERGQYALEFGEPAHPLITEEVRAGIAALAVALKRGQFGALPAVQAEVDQFLLARRGSPTVPQA